MKKVVCFRQGTFLLIYRKGRETMKTDNKKTIRGPEILESIGVGLWMIRTNKETGYSEMYADKMLQRILGIEKELTKPYILGKNKTRIATTANKTIINIPFLLLF